MGRRILHRLCGAGQLLDHAVHLQRANGGGDGHVK